jgi:hypothetical protein
MARKPKNAPADTAITDDGIDEIEQAAAVSVAADTLSGDLRDFILDRLRHEQSKQPWHMRSEDDQRDTVHTVEAAVREVVTKAVTVIASAGRRTIAATLEQVTVKDGIVGKLVMSKHDALRHALFDAVGSRVLIVVADAEEFEGEKAPVDITPDQGDIERVSVLHSTDDERETPFH